MDTGAPVDEAQAAPTAPAQPDTARPGSGGAAGEPASPSRGRGVQLPKEREVEFAEFETRMRKFLLELVEPTIQKASSLQLDIDAIKNLTDKHAKSIQDVTLASVKAEQQISIVEHFREEMSRWDVQRRGQEAKVAEELSLMKHELDGFRYNLERKEASIHGLQRTVDRVTAEMNRLQDSQDQLRKYCEERIDQQSKSINTARADLEVKLIALETKHNSLADELWGEETGLAKVTGELSKTNLVVQQLTEEMKKVQDKKASLTQLAKVQEEVNELIREATSNVTSLKLTVGNVVSDVKEHFRTASNTIAAHNATMIAEIRGSYQEELDHSAKLRQEVMKFMQDTQAAIKHLEQVAQSSHDQTEAMVREVRLDVEELNRKRKRDKANADIENKALKKRLGGVFDNSDLVLKGLEHLSGVLAALLESNRMQAALELQDDNDRRKVALTGYKEQGGKDKQEGGKTPRKAGKDQSVISVDNRCLSCSGQTATVLAGFKIACLQYAPGQVKYETKDYDRSELLVMRNELVEQAHEALVNGPEGLHKDVQRKMGGDMMGDTGGGSAGQLPNLAQTGRQGSRPRGSLTAR